MADHRMVSRSESRDPNGTDITFGYDRKTHKQLKDGERLETAFLVKRKNSLPLVAGTEAMAGTRRHSRPQNINKKSVGTTKHLEKLSLRNS